MSIVYIAEVHVWRDGNKWYSVSTVGDDGGEIECVGGGEFMKAWKRGCKLADSLGVVCKAIDLCGATTMTYNGSK